MITLDGTYIYHRLISLVLHHAYHNKSLFQPCISHGNLPRLVVRDPSVVASAMLRRLILLTLRIRCEELLQDVATQYAARISSSSRLLLGTTQTESPERRKTS